MKEYSVGIRELKANLSRCVREVRRGATVVVTAHGRRVARIVPEGESVQERLATLQNAGAILWSGRRLSKAQPKARAHGRRTVASILVENRG